MMLAVLMLLLYFSASASTVEVTTHLYGTAELPCTFPFVSGPEELYVTWEKKENLNERGLAVHSFREGQDHSEDQDPSYRGRTEMVRDLSRGKLNLRLKDVDFTDEGTYYCQAANPKDRGNQPIKLSINKLSAKEPGVTVISLSGKRRLKCLTTGVFRVPQVVWYNREKEDLSSFASLIVTDLGDGTQQVESVLDYDAEINKHYFCRIQEGRLRRTARAVMTDGGQSVTFTDEL
ncbi:V-set domain-containing T-cell activation inhibitor 1-like isoform X2 [Ascaphus truei]|uniref:V-set domain-containing T-cell activation inhibitor 1-like isoform X2 n=1 Tax=Ascaphus truei TaxID=8439 RepID=UPI003F5972F4